MESITHLIVVCFLTCAPSKKSLFSFLFLTFLIMEIPRLQVDFKAPHVAFLDAQGRATFAMVSSNIHSGCKVLQYFNDFFDAAKFCRVYNNNIKNQNTNA